MWGGAAPQPLCCGPGGLLTSTPSATPWPFRGSRGLRPLWQCCRDKALPPGPQLPSLTEERDERDGKWTGNGRNGRETDGKRTGCKNSGFSTHFQTDGTNETDGKQTGDFQVQGANGRETDGTDGKRTGNGRDARSAKTIGFYSFLKQTGTDGTRKRKKNGTRVPRKKNIFGTQALGSNGRGISRCRMQTDGGFPGAGVQTDGEFPGAGVQMDGGFPGAGVQRPTGRVPSGTDGGNCLGCVCEGEAGRPERFMPTDLRAHPPRTASESVPQ